MSAFLAILFSSVQVAIPGGDALRGPAPGVRVASLFTGCAVVVTGHDFLAHGARRIRRTYRLHSTRTGGQSAPLSRRPFRALLIDRKPLKRRSALKGASAAEERGATPAA